MPATLDFLCLSCESVTGMEIEAKLLAPSAQVLDRIALRRRLGPYRIEPAFEQRLETVYVDTSRRDLGRAALALRIRKIGRAVEVTLKESGAVRGEVHRRPERTVLLSRVPRFPFLPPRGEIRSRVLAPRRGRALMPLLITRIHRRALLGRRPGARGPIAEIDLDRGDFEIPSGRRRRYASAPRRRLYEVEIELKRGTEGELAEIVRALRRDYALKRSLLSKLERGLRWSGLVKKG